MTEPAILLQIAPPLRRMKALKASWKPILFNWLVPGLGYWTIGEKLRAKVLLGVSLTFCLLAFLQLHFGAVNGITGGVFVPKTDPFEWMPTLGALGTLGVGPIYTVYAWAFGGPAAEPVRNLTQEYGATYLMVAGLLNWLVCFDIFDRVTGRWIYRLPKDELEVLGKKDVKES